MSRSWKKPFVQISKAWDQFKERMFRRRAREELRKIEQEYPFDPDRDFEESLDYKKMGDWGTVCGFDVPPDENDDTWMHEEYDRLRRKK